jgi:hypothetical protein
MIHFKGDFVDRNHSLHTKTKPLSKISRAAYELVNVKTGMQQSGT